MSRPFSADPKVPAGGEASPDAVLTVQAPPEGSVRRPTGLETRLRVLLGLLLIPLLLLGAVSALVVSAEGHASAHYEQLLADGGTVAELSVDLKSVLQDGSAYLAGHDAVHRSLMQRDAADVTAGLNALEASSVLGSAERSTLAAAAASWRICLASIVAIQAIPSGSGSGASETAALADLSKNVTTVSGQAEILKGESARDLVVAAQDRQSREYLAYAALAAALVLGLLAGLGLSRRFSRSLMRPLSSMVSAAERIAAGDSADPIEFHGPRELEDLEHAFNTMNRQLREREARFLALVENAADGILVVAPTGDVVFVTPRMKALVGEAGLHFDGRLIHLEDLPRIQDAWAQVLSEGPGASAEVEARLAVVGEGWRHVFARLTNRIADEAIGGVIFNVTDVSERHEYEQKLTYMALHDGLTGLANRRLFLERLDVAMRKGRQGQPNVSVAYIDFDDFKQINDSYSHQAGDDFLREMGRRLSQCVRPEDLVSRLGGDEFAVLLDHTPRRDAVSAARRFLNALERVWEVEGREIRPRASLGVATSPAGGVSAETLLADADLAMYFAKRRGKGRFEVFTKPMRDELLERLRLGEDLKTAVAADSLEVRYQPIVELRTGEVVGVEALARWNHPALGWIAPTSFIPLAEEVGVIDQIDFWMLEQACRQSAAWRQAGLPEIRIAVNLTAITLEHPGLIAHVKRILAEARMKPSLLEMELTEGIAITDSQVARTAMELLREIGVRLAIDDFGTGYSALGRLRTLPFDRLKVDKVFIDELATDHAGATLVESILEMARVLHLEVVAEGVESQKQADFLKRNACDFGQGFLFSEPLPAEELTAMLRGHPRSAARDGVGSGFE